MRKASSLLLAMVLIAGPAIPASGEKAGFVTSHAADLNPGGRVEIQDSFGELHVTGWDESRIEVVVRRNTRKDYDAATIAKAEEMLRQVVVDIEQPEPDHVVITTRYPDRKLLTRPLRGKSNLELEYEVRIPRKTALKVKHDIGTVEIEDITGDVNATCRIGNISVNLPPDVSFGIDAKTRIGHVDSSMPNPPDDVDSRLYARVGIGEITIRPHAIGGSMDEMRQLDVEVI